MKYLAALPVSAQRDYLLGQGLAGWAEVDWDSAVAWARQLPDVWNRARILEAAVNTAEVHDANHKLTDRLSTLAKELNPSEQTP